MVEYREYVGVLPQEAWLHDKDSYNRRSKICVTYSTCKKYSIERFDERRPKNITVNVVQV